MRRLAIVTAAAGLLLLPTPAGAQQLVDAGREGDGSGGLAFVLFTIMVIIIGASLFFLDRVRRRATDDD